MWLMFSCHAGALHAGSQAGEHMDFPGGRVPFTSTLSFAGGPDARAAPMACYRTIDSAGGDVPDASVPHPLGQHGCPTLALKPRKAPMLSSWAVLVSPRSALGCLPGPLSSRCAGMACRDCPCDMLTIMRLIKRCSRAR